MKWVIRKGKFPPGIPDEDKPLFNEIELKHNDGDPDLADELDKKDFTAWVLYPDQDPQLKPIKVPGQAGQRKYELFVGGFLYYHDVELKKYPTGYKPDGTKYLTADFEHKVYFEWYKVGSERKVRIWINKTPSDYNPNPPAPPPPPPPESA